MKFDKSAAVRFSVLALLLVCLVGGASSLNAEGVDLGSYYIAPDATSFSDTLKDVSDGSHDLTVFVKPVDSKTVRIKATRASDGARIAGLEVSSDSIKADGTEVLSNPEEKWYKITLDFDYSSDWYDIYINEDSKATGIGFSFGNSGSEIGQVGYRVGDTSNNGVDRLAVGDFNSFSNDLGISNAVYDDSYEDQSISDYSNPSQFRFEKRNSPPQFNSTSHNDCLIGESCDYGAEVFDSDGSISYTNLSLSYGGSTVLSDEQRTGTTSPVWNDVFTPQDGNKWLNATLEVVDDKGAVTEKEINRYLSDEAPAASISDPGNQTYFKYDIPLQFSASDSDSEPSEDYFCDLDKDGSLYKEYYLKEGINSTYTDTVRSDLGSHTVDVTCTDGSGNTGTSNTKTYTVKALQLVDQFSNSKAYETENQSFTADLKTGSMVKNVEFNLVYDGTNQDTSTLTPSGVQTISSYLYHEIPLVDNNKTSKNWKITYEANLSDYNSGYETQTGETPTQSQNVWHSFSFNQHILEDGFTQLEASILDYTAEVKRNFAQAEGEVNSDSSTFSQTGETKNLEKNQLNYSTEFTTDLVNSDSTFQITSNFTYSYNSQTRSFSNSKNVNIDNINVSKSSGEKTLVLKTRDEVNNSLQNSNIELGLTVSNPDQPTKKEFFGFTLSSSDTYELYLQPTYATVNMQAFQDTTSLEYQNTDNNYPKRRYYFQNETLNNQSFDTSLYMLKENQGTQVQFELLDPDLNPLSGYLIRVERVFPSQEDTKTVAMIKTGSNGKGSTFIDTDEKYVFSIFDQKGELVDQKGPQTITENPTTLEIEPTVEPSFANLVNDVRFTDIQKDNDSLTVSYLSETERLNNISLTVYKETLFGKNLVASSSSTDLSGVLQVSGFNASENRLFYELEGRFGQSKLILGTGSFGQIGNKYGDGGIFLSILTFLVLTFSGVQRPSASVALGVIAIFVTAFTGLMPVTQSALISVTALGAVMIWRMSTKA